MKILQISAASLSENYRYPTITMGLGDDNKIYYWDENIGEWRLDIFQQNIK